MRLSLFLCGSLTGLLYLVDGENRDNLFKHLLLLLLLFRYSTTYCFIYLFNISQREGLNDLSTSFTRGLQYNSGEILKKKKLLLLAKKYSN